MKEGKFMDEGKILDHEGFVKLQEETLNEAVDSLFLFCNGIRLDLDFLPEEDIRGRLKKSKR